MERKIINFNSMVSNYEVINPEFARVKVYVCYAGKNRNRSEISKETLDEMAKTIYGIPVVAEYDETNNCFKGHGGKTEITDQGINFKQTTVPYGFVDPTTPVFYEDVRELDGITINKYLCCYAYLWYKRYPEVESVLKNQETKKIGQSMEINVDDYSWTDDDYCLIKKGSFSALAMLGVEPCFESAMVTSKFSKTDIEGEYQDMIQAFKKYTLENLEGGNTVEENKEFEAEVEVETETTETEEFKKKKRKCSLCEQEFEVAEDFSDEEEFTCDTCKETKEDFEAKYNESLTEIADLKAKCTDFQADLENAKAEYSILETEVKELREYKTNIEFEKHKVEVDEKLEQFNELEEVEGFKEIIKDKYTCDNLDDLIIKIKAFAYDNNITLNKKQSKKNFAKETVKIPVMGINKEIPNASAWDILDKYREK